MNYMCNIYLKLFFPDSLFRNVIKYLNMQSLIFVITQIFLVRVIQMSLQVMMTMMMKMMMMMKKEKTKVFEFCKQCFHLLTNI